MVDEKNRQKHSVQKMWGTTRACAAGSRGLSECHSAASPFLVLEFYDLLAVAWRCGSGASVEWQSDQPIRRERRDGLAYPRDETGRPYPGTSANPRFSRSALRPARIRRDRRDARQGPDAEKPGKKAEFGRGVRRQVAKKDPLAMRRIRRPAGAGLLPQLDRPAAACRYSAPPAHGSAYPNAIRAGVVIYPNAISVAICFASFLFYITHFPSAGFNPAASSAAFILGAFSADRPATGERHGPSGVPSILSAALTPPGAVQSPTAIRSGWSRACAAWDAFRSPRTNVLYISASNAGAMLPVAGTAPAPPFAGPRRSACRGPSARRSGRGPRG